MPPSGAKCGTKFKTRYPSWGRGHLAQRVGEPNPYPCIQLVAPLGRIPGHVAPLGSKCGTEISRHCIHRGGEVTLSSGLGNPTPTYTTSLAHVPIFVPPVFRCYRNMSPSGGKCGTIGGAVSIVGERSPCPAGWGTQPLRTVCDNTTLRSSGARGLDVSRCYRHIAPLERNAATCTEIQDTVSTWGRGFLAQRVGEPNPYGPCATIPHCAPLERGDWTCRAAIDISLLWSERRQCTEIQDIASIVGERFPRPAGWGTQPLRTVCDNTTLRSSGARGLVCVALL